MRGVSCVRKAQNREHDDSKRSNVHHVTGTRHSVWCLLPIYRPGEPIAKHLKFRMQRPIPSYAGAVSSMIRDSGDAVGNVGWVLFAVAVLGCLAEEVWHLRKHWHERHLDSAFAAQIHATAAA